MKKSLVLAMAMALGVTASAYAANPFSDVPAGHWAYDSVSELAAAGVVDGYTDGTFGGDKLMTRYEMAQIVAKAMVKGANVDKLAAEFADELDNMGVRVANLEKKVDNVKITGEVRYRYADTEHDIDAGDVYKNDLRTRLWVKGQINDDWSYTGMLENTQDFSNDAGDEGVDFQRAYVEGKLGGMDITAGRYNAFFANGYVYDTRVDGVELVYGDKLQVKGFAGKATDGYSQLAKESYSYGNYAGAEVTTAVGGLNLMGGYVNFKDMGKGFIDVHFKGAEVENAIWYVGADYSFGDLTLNGMYLKGDMSTTTGLLEKYVDDDGYVVGLKYKGAKAAEVGSYGLFANYYDQGGQTYVAHTTDATTFVGTGFKGYGVGMDYTVAKNMVAKVAYYDTESKLAEDTGSNVSSKVIWSELTFSF